MNARVHQIQRSFNSVCSFLHTPKGAGRSKARPNSESRGSHCIPMVLGVENKAAVKRMHSGHLLVKGLLVEFGGHGGLHMTRKQPTRKLNTPGGDEQPQRYGRQRAFGRHKATPPPINDHGRPAALAQKGFHPQTISSFTRSRFHSRSQAAFRKQSGDEQMQGTRNLHDSRLCSQWHLTYMNTAHVS